MAPLVDHQKKLLKDDRLQVDICRCLATVGSSKDQPEILQLPPNTLLYLFTASRTVHTTLVGDYKDL